jgi:hypothetical protein
VAAHIAEVLANVDAAGHGDADRRRLRLVALVHDALKGEVDRSRPRTGENHHAMRARRFAERFVAEPVVLDLVELHDEAYNAYMVGRRRRDWPRAERRARRLIARLGAELDLYLAFYRADNATGSKSEEPLHWFEALAAAEPAGKDPKPPT